MIKIPKDAEKIIEENPVAFATVNRVSKPNVIAVAFVKVISRNQVLITDVAMRQTRNNLKENNNICLAVWNKNWKGYKLVGKAKYFLVGKWKRFIEEMPENKNEKLKGAIIVTISKIIRLK